MNNSLVIDFISGMLFSGMPGGILCVATWYHLNKNLDACLWWFLAIVFCGGLLGVLLVIPLTAISLYCAFKEAEAKKSSGQNPPPPVS